MPSMPAARISAASVLPAAAWTADLESGLEHVLVEQVELVRRRRIGLLAHPASIDRRLPPMAELRREAGAQVTAPLPWSTGPAAPVAEVGDEAGATARSRSRDRCPSCLR